MFLDLRPVLDIISGFIVEARDILTQGVNEIVVLLGLDVGDRWLFRVRVSCGFVDLLDFGFGVTVGAGDVFAVVL